MEFDLAEGMAARDAAFQVLEEKAPLFSKQVRDFINRMRPGTAVTGEDIRRLCTDAGIVPYKHKCWGGAINSAVRTGLLKATGEYTQMKSVKSHARETKIYEVIRK